MKILKSALSVLLLIMLIAFTALAESEALAPDLQPITPCFRPQSDKFYQWAMERHEDLLKRAHGSVDAHFQQAVANMNVFSDVKGIVSGTNLTGGNIEFWPNNYTAANSANVPNASSATYDFGDQPVDPADGYGSMQVHNHDAQQTLFVLNHWRNGQGADLGIGNASTGSPDWTFSANAGGYKVKRLRVFVRCT